MRVERFLVRSFSETNSRPEYVVKIPKGSMFLNKAKVLHDGIYVFYAVPDIILGEDTTEIFKILQPKEPIPDNYNLVDILDIIFEVNNTNEVPGTVDKSAEPTQGIMIFPLYKQKE